MYFTCEFISFVKKQKQKSINQNIKCIDNQGPQKIDNTNISNTT
jgi:hypothetical protein